MSRTPRPLLHGHDIALGVEYRVTRDRDLLSGKPLVRVEYRLDAAKRRWWHSFLVVLEGDATLESVFERLDELIAWHREQSDVAKPHTRASRAGT